MHRKIFTEEERSLLILLVKNYPIIESKKTDAGTLENKCKNWQEITDLFNSHDVEKRSCAQLRKCWRNLKCKAKKYIGSDGTLHASDLQALNDSNHSQSLQDTLHVLSHHQNLLSHLESGEGSPVSILPDDGVSPLSMLEQVLIEDLSVVQDTNSISINKNFQPTNSQPKEFRNLRKIVKRERSSSSNSRVSTEDNDKNDENTENIKDNSSLNALNGLSFRQCSEISPQESRTNDCHSPYVETRGQSTLAMSKEALSNEEIQLLKARRNTERLTQSELVKKKELVELQMSFLVEEENRKIEKHQKEMLLLEAQINYWNKKSFSENSDKTTEN